MLSRIKAGWKAFAGNHPTLAQFLIFFLVSNGVTVLQMILMPVFRNIFGMTSLVDTNFQIWHVAPIWTARPIIYLITERVHFPPAGAEDLRIFWQWKLPWESLRSSTFFSSEECYL